MRDSIFAIQKRLSHYYKPVTKSEAAEALRLHEEDGNGAEGVAFKFLGIGANNHRAQLVGDDMINLGRYLRDQPEANVPEPLTSKELTTVVRSILQWNNTAQEVDKLEDEVKEEILNRTMEIIMKSTLHSE